MSEKTLKQRLCGFINHDSKLMVGYNSGVPFSVSVICKKCGYKTRWFDIEDVKQAAIEINKSD